MKADPMFKSMPKPFWASIQSISQETKYKEKGADRVKIPTIGEIEKAYKKLGLDEKPIVVDGAPTVFAKSLLEYFKYRADKLNNFVEPRLMNLKQAKEVFDKISSSCKPPCPIPMIKQKGDMYTPAFLTGIVNMVIKANIGTTPCDYDPQKLTTFTVGGKPIRTLVRRVDGALPHTANPVVIWEIKEYYHNKSFGSRIADGVYITMLDGMELTELRISENIQVSHCLILDARIWWTSGKSYLCRIIDMLNMGYVDEVLFGSEVVERLPTLAKDWVKMAKKQTMTAV